MSKAPRITNRERVLLSLEDAPQYDAQYEVPRRFSQRGLSQRLDMAQSHVSRAIKDLLSDEMISQRRRRVTGERRRVIAYNLTESGSDRTVDLRREMLAAAVLTRASDGTLERLSLRDLLHRAERTGERPPSDALGMADLLRGAEVHDNMPLLEDLTGEAEADEGEPDLSAEAIGLHLELAEMRRRQGDLPSALDHLGRAAGLHRQRGNPAGEVRCLLAASSLGAPVEDATRLRAQIDAIVDVVARLEAYLMLHDAVLAGSPEQAAELLAHLDDSHPDHPEVALRLAEATIRRGGIPDLSSLPTELPGGYELRGLLWRANLLRLTSKVAAMTGDGWPDPVEVRDALALIGPSAEHPHALVHGELTLELARNPNLGDDERVAALESSWSMQPPLPTLGHIGFQLAGLCESERRNGVLEQLQQRFLASGDEVGAEVCQARMAE